MKLSERLGRLDHAQRSTRFKIAASVVVIVAGILVFFAYFLASAAERQATRPSPDQSMGERALAERAPGGGPAGATDPAAATPDGTPSASDQAQQAARDLVDRPEDAIDASQRVVENILAARADPTNIALATLVGVALALGLVWLGMGLTASGILIAGVLVLGPALLILGRSAEAFVIAMGGSLLLLLAFTALLRAAAVALSSAGPTSAVARNVLAEAVRLRVGLVFIIPLLGGMALLPQLLEDGQPLRYRVQTFIQAGSAGSFWIIALLVVVFSIATVAFEQRDKVIWQTMTKPVSAWRYLLGKWLGVTTLAAILLTVSGVGVYLFTAYLRTQPAQGEVRAFVADGAPITEDRLILETQVLSARSTRYPLPPALDMEAIERNVQQQIDAEFQRLGEIRAEDEFAEQRTRAEMTAKMRSDLIRAVTLASRSIEPGEAEVYEFAGLLPARNSGRPVYLRFKINSGSNRPDMIYRLTMQFAGAAPFVKESALAQFHSIPLPPDIIDAEGRVFLQVINGDVFERVANPETISFGADGLEISFTDGSFLANFMRAYAILMVKLAFIAMIGVWAATFLSFPVAALVTLAIFLSAEGAGFLKAALENFSTEDLDGNTIYIRVVVAWITQVVTWIFGVYAELRPTTRLVEGLRLSWGDFSLGIAVLGAWASVMFGIAVAVFRNRELATYSGQ